MKKNLSHGRHGNTRNEKGVVPKLRFPEFKHSTEWSCNRFEQIFELKSTYSFTRDDLNYEAGSIKNIHYGDIHTKFATLFHLRKELVPFINESESLNKIKPDSFCQESDMVFADASEDMADIGKSIELIDLNNEKLVSGLHTILARQKHGVLVKGFGGHLFRSTSVRKQIQREAQGAKVLGISSGRLSSIIIPYPDNKKEQSRIADCLSSLDSLIAAHSQKLDGLKSYKKGLMQQLFPAKGEKIPKLRFPEFRKSGEWEEKTLGGIAENLDSRRIPVTENIREKGDIPYYGASGIVDYVKGYIFDEDILCISEDGANLVARAYPIAFSVSGKSWVNNHAHVIRFNDKSSQIIVENYLNSIDLNDYLTGMAQPKLNRAMLDIIPIALPKLPEQQRIASFLSSIDNLITVQSQKIESLKIHKKGLMQQLFPAMDEANA